MTCFSHPAAQSYSLLSRDVTSVLSVQMVVQGKWQGKLLLQNINMYMIVTLEVVYDHVGKCRKLALCYFIQINLILFCLTTIWKWHFKQKTTWLKPKNMAKRKQHINMLPVACVFESFLTKNRGTNRPFPRYGWLNAKASLSTSVWN